jgi:pyruvate dehydrogenase E1 component alpha subunit
MSQLRNDLSLEMYRRMLLIRLFDERVTSFHAKGELPGAAHTSIGQEGEIVGTCMALRKDDYMVGNHRSHGHPIGKGAAIGPLMAEILGKATGICKGKGGSMHLSDFAVGSLGETSIVGSGLPVAVGAALGAKMQRSDRVALAFFGDGASNEGTFHESLNLACVWKLPVIFLCENNGHAVSTPATYSCATPNIADRAAGYAMASAVVDGQDVEACYAAVSEAAERARAGKGPTLVEAKTYRFDEHSLGLPVISRPERDSWLARDPIKLYRAKLLAAGMADAALADVEKAATAEMDAAVAFAQSSPLPAPGDAYDDVFAKRVVPYVGAPA